MLSRTVRLVIEVAQNVRDAIAHHRGAIALRVSTPARYRDSARIAVNAFAADVRAIPAVDEPDESAVSWLDIRETDDGVLLYADIGDDAAAERLIDLPDLLQRRLQDADVLDAVISADGEQALSAPPPDPAPRRSPSNVAAYLRRLLPERQADALAELGVGPLCNPDVAMRWYALECVPTMLRAVGRDAFATVLRAVGRDAFATVLSHTRSGDDLAGPVGAALIDIADATRGLDLSRDTEFEPAYASGREIDSVVRQIVLDTYEYVGDHSRMLTSLTGAVVTISALMPLPSRWPAADTAATLELGRRVVGAIARGIAPTAAVLTACADICERARVLIACNEKSRTEARHAVSQIVEPLAASLVASLFP